MMRSAEQAEHKHDAPVGASLLAISIHAEFWHREQARSYEKQRLDSPVAASLLAISISAESRYREQARSYEEHKHALRLRSGF